MSEILPSYVEADRQWFNQMHSSERAEYRELHRAALKNPEVDFFEHWHPQMPKRFIGRYVSKHGVSVPLVRSQKEWERVFDARQGMLRSELPQDYSGLSGQLSSRVLSGLDLESPPDPETYYYPEIPYVHAPSMGSLAIQLALSRELTAQMRAGQIDPGKYMWRSEWARMADSHLKAADNANVPLDMHVDYSTAQASFWRYVPGHNVHICRDPVREDHYYIRGAVDDHNFEVAGISNMQDRTFEYTQGNTHTSYTLPVLRIIELYETVRTLPYFDISELPVMELQVDTRGKLHWLQYKKTGRKLQEAPTFSLPTGRNVFTMNQQVRGATGPEGEKLRLYINPHKRLPSMDGQGFYATGDRTGMTSNNILTQYAATTARVFVSEYFLSLTNSHFSSTPLYAPKVSIGLAGFEESKELNYVLRGCEQPSRTTNDPPYTNVRYVDAIVTSTGTAATIESDWEVKTEAA